MAETKKPETKKPETANDAAQTAQAPDRAQGHVSTTQAQEHRTEVAQTLDAEAQRERQAANAQGLDPNALEMENARLKQQLAGMINRGEVDVDSDHIPTKTASKSAIYDFYTSRNASFEQVADYFDVTPEQVRVVVEAEQWEAQRKLDDKDRQSWAN